MRHAVVFGLAALLALPLPARAEKKAKPKAKPKDREAAVEVVFSARQRDAARHYFVETHGRGHCPPGLAKKRNGCLPPGQAKKRYVVGRPLPHDVDLRPLPEVLVVHIGAPPPGYRYAIVDGDLLKLAVGTLLVVDAISGLVD